MSESDSVESVSLINRYKTWAAVYVQIQVSGEWSSYQKRRTTTTNGGNLDITFIDHTLKIILLFSDKRDQVLIPHL